MTCVGVWVFFVIERRLIRMIKCVIRTVVWILSVIFIRINVIVQTVNIADFSRRMIFISIRKGFRPGDHLYAYHTSDVLHFSTQIASGLILDVISVHEKRHRFRLKEKCKKKELAKSSGKYCSYSRKERKKTSSSFQ